MRQVEVSRTLVVDDPRRARAFFESLVADNVVIARPEQVSVVFGRRSTPTLPAYSAPGCSGWGPRCRWTSATSTRGSSRT
jgi:hypothetical protein